MRLYDRPAIRWQQEAEPCASGWALCPFSCQAGVAEAALCSVWEQRGRGKVPVHGLILGCQLLLSTVSVPSAWLIAVVPCAGAQTCVHHALPSSPAFTAVLLTPLSWLRLHSGCLPAPAGCVFAYGDFCTLPWPLQHTGCSSTTCGPLLTSCSISASSFLSLRLPVLSPRYVCFFLLQTKFWFACSSRFSQTQCSEPFVTSVFLSLVLGWWQHVCTYTHTHTLMSMRWPLRCCEAPSLLPCSTSCRAWGWIWATRNPRNAAHARHCALLLWHLVCLNWSVALRFSAQMSLFLPDSMYICISARTSWDSIVWDPIRQHSLRISCMWKCLYSGGYCSLAPCQNPCSQPSSP